MLTYDEALAQIFSQIAPLSPAELPLQDALGCVLAEDIISPQDLPPFDNSSMDGFAVRAADFRTFQHSAGQGDIPAGALSVPALTPGTALRIMTGRQCPPARMPSFRSRTRRAGDGVAFLGRRHPGPVYPAGGGRCGGRKRCRDGGKPAAACGDRHVRRSWARLRSRLSPPARRDPQHRR